MPQPKPAKARPTLILLLGFLILLPALAFLALFSTTPGDHTRLRYSLPPSPLGLRIESRLNGDSTAGQDTYLLAINAQTVDNLLSNLVANPLQSQPASRAEEYPYLITDGTNTQEILVQFATPSFIRLLVEDWSFFLSFLLLLSVSSVVYFRRPELPAARTYFILSCLIVSSGLVFFIGIRASDLLTGLIFWLWIWSVLPIYGLLVGAVVHFALVFPEPRPVLRRHPSAILLAYICVWIPYLALAAALLPSYVTPSQRIQVLLEGTGVMTL
ncbi:MAG: hypothetical protein R3335_10450, partial [Anaerolineales bacterium]|nr:hypothetical protein [Anaerolineales bacterium]